MPRNRTQSLIIPLEKHCKPDADIVSRKEAHTNSVGVRFVAKLGDNLAPKDAVTVTDFMALHRPKKSISTLFR